MSSRPRSAFADRSAAQRALALAMPMLEPLLGERAVVGSGFLYVVILDPAVESGTFDDAVLLEHAIGDRSRWDADYAGFARAKARLAWRTRRDAALVQTLQPQRLCAGDTLVAGAICLDGIIVAVSGAHPQWDEAFATCLAACLRAIAKERCQQALADRRSFA
jgi:hypothetical protein